VACCRAFFCVVQEAFKEEQKRASAFQSKLDGIYKEQVSYVLINCA